MRYVLLLCLLLSLVFAGTPNKQRKSGKRASHGFGALFSPAAVVDDDGFYHYTHEAKHKVTEERDPLRFMKLKTKLHPTAFFVDKEEEVTEVLCESPNVLTVRFSEPIPARWGVGDLVFGDEDWECVDDKYVVGPLARRILEVRSRKSREWIFITESVASSLAFEEADVSLSIENPPQINFDFLDEPLSHLPQLSAKLDAPTPFIPDPKRSVEQASSPGFESPLRNLFMTGEKIPVRLTTDAPDGTVVKLYLMEGFLSPTALEGSNTIVKNKVAVYDFVAKSAWVGESFFIKANVLGTSVESSYFTLNVKPKIVITDPLSSSTFSVGDILTPTWFTAPEYESSRFDVSLYIEVPFGKDNRVAKFYTTRALPPKVNVTDTFESSNKYYWFIAYNCWSDYWCSYSAESKRFRVVANSGSEKNGPVIMYPSPRSSFSTFNLSISYEWANPPAEATLRLKRDTWGPDPTVLSLPVDLATHPSGFHLFDVPPVVGSTEYYFSMEYDCGLLLFPCIRESTFFAINAQFRVQWPNFNPPPSFKVTEAITASWSYTSQISTPVYLSLVKLMPVVNEYFSMHTITNPMTGTEYTLPANTLKQGTQFPVFWMLSYDCKVQYSGVGYFCTNELSPSFSIPSYSLQTWNYDTDLKQPKESSIVLYENEYYNYTEFENKTGSTTVHSKFSVSCTDCYILNELRTTNLSLTIAGLEITSMTADIVGLLTYRATPTVSVEGQAQLSYGLNLLPSLPVFGLPFPFFRLGLYFSTDFILRLDGGGSASVGLQTEADAGYSLHYRSDLKGSSLDSSRWDVKPVLTGTLNAEAFIGFRPEFSLRAEIYEKGPGLTLEAAPVFGLGVSAEYQYPPFSGNSSLDYPNDSFYHFGRETCAVDHYVTLDTYFKLDAEIALKGVMPFEDPSILYENTFTLYQESIASGCFLASTSGCSADCDDNDECTADFCSDDSCQHVVKECTAVPQCHTGYCSSGVCHYVYSPGLACDDGDPCTVEDICLEAGFCSGMPVDCDDNNTCTEDLCGSSGCYHTPISGVCDDGDLCTENDACSDGVCKGTPKLCSDFNECTTDTCSDGICNSIPDDMNLCSDNDPNTWDHCSLGQCISAPEECPQTVCSQGLYSNGTCEVFPINNGGACDDSRSYTVNDRCIEGYCSGDEINAATNIDYVGNTIYTVDVASPADCDSYCKFYVTNCDCWVYAPEGTSTCTLMSPCPKPILRDPSYLGGIWSGRRICDDFVNFDFSFTEMYQYGPVNTTDDCRAYCLADASCITWTFLPELELCKINSGLEMTIQSDNYLGGVTSGFNVEKCLLSSNNPIHHIHGVNFEGYLIGDPVENVFSPEYCEATCRANATCDCWAYDPLFSSCQMKYGCVSPYTIDRPYVSGLLSCDVYPGIDFIGTIILQDITVATDYDCLLLCQQAPACVTWTFDPWTACTLHSDFQYSVARMDPAFVGGIKDCRMFRVLHMG